MSDPNASVTAAATATTVSALTVARDHFVVRFDGIKWTAAWRWRSTPQLPQRPPIYVPKSLEVRERFHKEVRRWVSEGWLKPSGDGSSPAIPLMAIPQPQKNKVRPVLDFRDLNRFICTQSGDADVCHETVRRWRRKASDCALVDLADAYMQIRISEECSQFMSVEFEGKRYKLTRMGFGLSCAPEILQAVVRTVLAADPRIRAATDSYFDDILVDQSIATAEEVVAHLRKFGLVCKPAVVLRDTKALGMYVYSDSGAVLRWKRPEPAASLAPDPQSITMRELWAVTGKLVAHYPVCGWLRIGCGLVKRASTAKKWDDPAGPAALQLLKKLLRRIQDNGDPAKGVWGVPDSSKVVLWCDASSIATAAIVEIGGDIIEDAAWLRPQGDGQHINLAELNAVLFGLNVALKWSPKKIDIVTDSATVKAWLDATRTRDHRIKVKGMSEMLVKRRLSVLYDTLNEAKVAWTTRLVPSSTNKADALTRVPADWKVIRWVPFATEKQPPPVAAAAADSQVREEVRERIKRLHSRHHLGVDRTYVLARRMWEDVSMEAVRDVISRCDRCASIDPAPKRTGAGELPVPECWKRVALDVTHMSNALFLSVTDCGPGRFTVWRPISSESASAIGAATESVFSEHGPPEEILTDNGTAFRSEAFRQLCEHWGVELRFRCAYRPSGNGIAERCHRTIKRIAARTRCSVAEAVFWWNVSAASPAAKTPADLHHARTWELPFRDRSAVVREAALPLGTPVYVKPPHARCTTEWEVGRVTDAAGDYSVEVDGVPRHLKDVRQATYNAGGGEGSRPREQPRPRRANRRPPARLIEAC